MKQAAQNQWSIVKLQHVLSAEGCTYVCAVNNQASNNEHYCAYTSNSLFLYNRCALWCKRIICMDHIACLDPLPDCRSQNLIDTS